jgi:hypothetical protein
MSGWNKKGNKVNDEKGNNDKVRGNQEIKKLLKKDTQNLCRRYLHQASRLSYISVVMQNFVTLWILCSAAVSRTVPTNTDQMPPTQ